MATHLVQLGMAIQYLSLDFRLLGQRLPVLLALAFCRHYATQMRKQAQIFPMTAVDVQRTATYQ